MGNGGQAPKRDRDRVADFGSIAIDKPSEQQQPDGIRSLKCRVDEAELLVGPAKLAVEKFFDQRKDLAIDVINGGREEEQGADGPSHTAHAVATASSACHTRPAGN